MVTEFTELQGTMGREYALLDGEGQAVAQAIGEQYMPRFAGDELPQSNEGRILAIADKLDNIMATFSRGMAPTGSQDPYALRRQALGILNILSDGNVHFPLGKILEVTLKNLPVEVENLAKLIDSVKDFFAQRAKNMLLDKGLRYDVVDAVLAVPVGDDLANVFVQADDLTAYLEILGRGHTSSFYPGRKYQQEPRSGKWGGCCPVPGSCGKSPVGSLQKVEVTTVPLEAACAFKKVLEANDVLAAPVNAFFDAVMVMDKDEAVKNNRLALMQEVKRQVNQTADLSQLIMK